MPDLPIQPPLPDEYAPFYGIYIGLLPEGDILQTLESQADSTRSLLSGIVEAQAEYRYAPGKWSIKEVVGHLCDTERIMAYRALRIARGDRTPLRGYDENEYVAQANFGARMLEDLIAEFQTVRGATLQLLRTLPEDAWTRRGIANDVEVSVRALAYIIAGHALHHTQVLRTRYLSPGA